MAQIRTTSKITVRLVQSVGGDEMVVAAARVSTQGDEAIRFAERDANEEFGLINFLMKSRHGGCFEHSSMTFFIRAPIFVWREFHRHRLMSFNEESARYKKLEPEFYVPPRDRPMMKVEGWKPGRPKFEFRDDHHINHTALCYNLLNSYRLAYTAYENNLELGVDPGIARACLPVGIMSSCWVTCNPRSLMHFLSLRTHEPEATFPSYPLYEIEVAARACERMFAEGWPLTYKAFCDCGRVAP